MSPSEERPRRRRSGQGRARPWMERPNRDWESPHCQFTPKLCPLYLSAASGPGRRKDEHTWFASTDCRGVIRRQCLPLPSGAHVRSARACVDLSRACRVGCGVDGRPSRLDRAGPQRGPVDRRKTRLPPCGTRQEASGFERCWCERALRRTCDTRSSSSSEAVGSPATPWSNLRIGLARQTRARDLPRAGISISAQETRARQVRRTPS